MKLLKCTKCDLNYVKPGEQYCSICSKSMKGLASDGKDVIELCPSCGRRHVPRGQEICNVCLQEQKRLYGYAPDEEIVADDDVAQDDMEGLQLLDEIDIPENDAPDEVKGDLLMDSDVDDPDEDVDDD